MFCYQCGKENEVNARFCRFCGAHIANAGMERKESYSVVLAGSGNNKVKLIKEIRLILNVGLADAKNAVDNVPTILKQSVSFEEANQVKNQLESLGAIIEIN